MLATGNELNGLYYFTQTSAPVIPHVVASVFPFVSNPASHTESVYTVSKFILFSDCGIYD